MSWLTRLLGRPRPAATSNRPGEWDDFWYEDITQARSLGVTEERAMALAAFYACIRNISEDLAKIPLHVYKRDGESREKQRDHNLHKTLNESANPLLAAMTLRELLMHWAIGWGNGYAEILPAAGGMELWPIHPRFVDIITQPNGREYYYQVREPETMAMRTLDPSQMFHLRGLGDSVKGYSIVTYAAESMNRGLAAQQFSRNFFANGASVSGVLQHPGKLDEQAQLRIARSWHRAYGGSGNTGKTAILEEGMVFNKLSLSPEDGQMLETMEFAVVDVARWFRMPPHKIQAYQRAQGWSTLEAANTDYVVDTLTPWAVRFEAECKRKLLSNEAKLYVRHNFDALQRGDMAARSAYYTAMRNMGVLTVNEIRTLEDMSPIGEEGDTRIEPMNMRPLGETEDPPEPPPSWTTQEAPPQDIEQDEDEEQQDDEKMGAMDDAVDGWLHDAARRLADKEIRGLRLRVNKLARGEYAREIWDDVVTDFYERHARQARKIVEPLEQAWRALGRNGETAVSCVMHALSDARARLSFDPCECTEFYKTREAELYAALRKGFGHEDAERTAGDGGEAVGD